jgi:hypothetical protein
MKAQTIDVQQATGRILCCTIFRAGGKKLLAKGHVISEEEARMIKTQGMNEVWVAELEEAEVGEDDAVLTNPNQDQERNDKSRLRSADPLSDALGHITRIS